MSSDSKDGGSREPKLVETSVSGDRNGVRSDEEIERLGLRFQTQRKLASGGMASILHAYDPVLGRHVAVKLLHASLVQQHGEVEAFLREARITAQLEHPNIVPVYELASGPASEWACFAMKLIRGQSLAERLAELGERRLSPSELPALLDALLKVCDAVSYAHGARILHLDLKPQNVMLGSHGQVYVMDWGIAVRCTLGEDGLLKPVDRHVSMRGTLAYMAPEQLDRELTDVDERADVYGIGAIIYDLLTGHPPFDARGDESDMQRLREHVVSDPLDDVRAHAMPPGLVRVAMRAVAREPSARYRSVAIMRAELEQLVRGGGWFRARSYQQDAIIVREGEPAEDAYILVEGECDVFKQTGETTLHLRRMHAGEVFGETSIVTRGPRTATVRAATPVSVLVVTRETLEWELSTLGWLGEFVRALASRFREADAARAHLEAELRAHTVPRRRTRLRRTTYESALPALPKAPAGMPGDRPSATRFALAALKLGSWRALAWVQGAAEGAALRAVAIGSNMTRPRPARDRA